MSGDPQNDRDLILSSDDLRRRRDPETCYRSRRCGHPQTCNSAGPTEPALMGEKNRMSSEKEQLKFYSRRKRPKQIKGPSGEATPTGSTGSAIGSQDVILGRGTRASNATLDVGEAHAKVGGEGAREDADHENKEEVFPNSMEHADHENKEEVIPNSMELPVATPDKLPQDSRYAPEQFEYEQCVLAKAEVGGAREVADHANKEKVFPNSMELPVGTPEKLPPDSGSAQEQFEYEQCVLAKAEAIRSKQEIFRTLRRPQPRGKEPIRCKTHWDVVLADRTWFAKDFQKERKWKLSVAKKVAAKVRDLKLDSEGKRLRSEKEEEQRARRLASLIAKEVKKFWVKVEKLVVYHHQLELQEQRKEAGDKHLDFLLGQTERYSAMLAETLANNVVNTISGSVPLVPCIQIVAGGKAGSISTEKEESQNKLAITRDSVDASLDCDKSEHQGNRKAKLETDGSGVEEGASKVQQSEDMIDDGDYNPATPAHGLEEDDETTLEEEERLARVDAGDPAAEDHKRRLLEVVLRLQDNELLLQRHFAAIGTAVRNMCILKRTHSGRPDVPAGYMVTLPNGGGFISMLKLLQPVPSSCASRPRKGSSGRTSSGMQLLVAKALNDMETVEEPERCISNNSIRTQFEKESDRQFRREMNAGWGTGNYECEAPASSGLGHRGPSERKSKKRNPPDSTAKPPKPKQSRVPKASKRARSQTGIPPPNVQPYSKKVKKKRVAPSPSPGCASTAGSHATTERSREGNDQPDTGVGITEQTQITLRRSDLPTSACVGRPAKVEIVKTQLKFITLPSGRKYIRREPVPASQM